MIGLALILIVAGAVLWATVRPDVGRALVFLGGVLLLLVLLLAAVGVTVPGGID